MKKCSTTVIGLFIIIGSTLSQTVTVKFIIADNFTKKSIPGVRVVNANGVCYSDNAGECYNSKLTKGENYFNFEKEGYEKRTNYMIFAVSDTTVTVPIIEMTRESFTKADYDKELNKFAYQYKDVIASNDTTKLRAVFDTSRLKFVYETMLFQYDIYNNKRGLKEFQTYTDKSSFEKTKLVWRKEKEF